MKRLLSLALSAALLAACATTNETVVKEKQYHSVKSEGGKRSIQRVTCSKPGPRVVVGSIRCTAAECQGGAARAGGLFVLLRLAGVPTFEGIGEGLRDMLTTALEQTGCLRVLDLRSLKELKELGIETKAARPDYMITGAVTSISFEMKSGSLGGGLIPFVGAVSTTRSKATLGMDIRVIRTSDGETVLSKTYTATSGKTSYGLGGAGTIGFGGALSGLSGTPMEEVARDILIRASQDIARELGTSVKVEEIPVK